MFAAIHIPTGLVVDVIDGPWYDFDKSKPRDFSAFPKYGWDILGADYEVKFPSGEVKDISADELKFSIASNS